MDPDANLTEQLELAESLKDLLENEPSAERDAAVDEDAERLADLVLALDGWIAGGGFLPKRWRREG